MARVVFDRSKAFGTIYGEHGTPPARYEQGGYLFDDAGNLVESLLTSEQKAEIEKAGKKGVVNPKVVKVDQIDIDDLNLTGWVTGDIDYPVTAVREAVRKRYGVMIVKAGEIADYLAGEAQLVPADQVAVKFREPERKAA